MHFNLYGLLIALGVLAAVFYISRETRRLGLGEELPVDLALWVVPPAILFSRIYYVVFNCSQYEGDLLSIFRVWEGGLAIYGGVIGGLLGGFLLSKRKKLSFALLADLVAPGLLLGQAIGRWGNFFNMEAFGYEVMNPALQFFPFAVKVGEVWHLATFFYESLWNLLGFVLLLNLRGLCYKKGKGWVFAWYLIWYGLGRMMIEGLRTDSLMLGDLRVSQGLSVVLLAAAGIIMILRLGLRKSWLLLLGMGLLAVVLSALSVADTLLPGYCLLFSFVFGLMWDFVTTGKEAEKA
ncbi:MAG: prolipoprotein diacylglyceryl transferase [Bacillota bacterium]|nr:prolipoprotein diacylglyceryl transferase [Bacillota bacterium]